MLTIKDIAKIAGVSYSTVSKVLNNYPDVGEETRKRVQKVIEEHRFTPNSSAQKLSMKKSNNIAIIMSNLFEVEDIDVIPLQELKGAVENAKNLGYEVALYSITSDSQKYKTYYSFCIENNIIGAIFSGIRTDDIYFQELANNDFPCVLIDIYAQGEHSSSLSIDNIEASIAGVQYFIDHGHRNIAIINGKLKSIVGIERYAGYCQALVDNGIELNSRYSISGYFDEDEAYFAGKKLLEENPEITAVFCASDIMAIGLYRAVKELGMQVGEDISIIGFDDIPLAKYITPALTTIRQDFFQFGYKSVDLLTDLIKKNKGQHLFMDYELVERESVKTLK